MPGNIEKLYAALPGAPRVWALTGVAGFIGSNLLERLLKLGQRVRGIDNFSTGSKENLERVRAAVGESAWGLFEFIEGDIVALGPCQSTIRSGTDVVLHQAALGSVPRSIADPVATHAANVTGFLNVIDAARTAGVRRVVYASSSSVYGDHPALPKLEGAVGAVLSPYAATKRMNEIFAESYSRCYAMELVGLRYFNIFGPGQSPDGPYAAVIPRFMQELRDGRAPEIFGDGETSRDFCYVENAVQANLLAACAEGIGSSAVVLNVAVGEQTSLNQLFAMIRDEVAKEVPAAKLIEVEYRDFRSGDIKHSLADISAARKLLGYQPTHRIAQGIKETTAWFLGQG